MSTSPITVDVKDNCSQSTRQSSTMGRKSKRPKNYNLKHYTSTDIILQKLTTTAQACMLFYVSLVAYLCFSEEFLFFTWHPLLLSTGWMFLMIEGVLILSKHNIVTGTLPKNIKIKLHWIIEAVAIVLATTGFIVVFINKNNLNKEHFKTWHALLGFIGIVCLIPNCILGVAALYAVYLRDYVKPKIVKFLHICCGSLVLCVGGTALILSVYTNWFNRHTNENVLVFSLGLVLVILPVVLTLIRPFKISYLKFKEIFL